MYLIRYYENDIQTVQHMCSTIVSARQIAAMHCERSRTRKATIQDETIQPIIYDKPQHLYVGTVNGYIYQDLR